MVQFEHEFGVYGKLIRGTNWLVLLPDGGDRQFSCRVSPCKGYPALNRQGSDSISFLTPGYMPLAKASVFTFIPGFRAFCPLKGGYAGASLPGRPQLRC